MKTNQEAIIDFFSRFEIRTIDVTPAGISERRTVDYVAFDGDFEREKEILTERLEVNENSFFNDQEKWKVAGGGGGV